MVDRLKAQIKGDKQIWWIVVLLSVAGVLAVYSSISSLAFRKMDGNTEAALIKQVTIGMVGLYITFIIHKLDIAKFTHIARILLFLSPLVLLSTFMFGEDIGEAKRSIAIWGFTIQTIDFVKLVLMVNLAAMLARRIHIEYKPRDLVEIIVWCGLLVFLIVFSDFATAFILGFTCFLVMWIGKVPNKYLFKMLLTLVGVVVLAILIGILYNAVTHKKIGRQTTIINRVEIFLGKDFDKNGFIGGEHGSQSKQINQSQVAIANGGFIGVGPGNSSQKNILPEAYSDYIYSIIVEEYGIFGGLVIMVLYLWLLARGIKNIDLTNRAFGGLLSVGLTLLIVIQAFTHIAVNVSLAPNTGLPLPLISRGGISALFTYVAMGVVLGVSRQSKENLA